MKGKWKLRECCSKTSFCPCRILHCVRTRGFKAFWMSCKYKYLKARVWNRILGFQFTGSRSTAQGQVTGPSRHENNVMQRALNPFQT
jgi:hypothetical protein